MSAHSALAVSMRDWRQSSGLLGAHIETATPMGGHPRLDCRHWPGAHTVWSIGQDWTRDPRGCPRSHRPSPRLSLHQPAQEEGTSGLGAGMFRVSHSILSPATCPSQVGGDLRPAWPDLGPKSAQSGTQEKGVLGKQRNTLECPWSAHQLLSCRTGARFGKLC